MTITGSDMKRTLLSVWRMPTRELVRAMIKSGIRAKLTCVDPKRLAPEFVGREFNEQIQPESASDNRIWHTSGLTANYALPSGAVTRTRWMAPDAGPPGEEL